MNCPNCHSNISEIVAHAIAEAFSRRAAAASARRETRTGGRSGGRKPKLTPCPKCGAMLGVVAMRAHARECRA